MQLNDNVDSLFAFCYSDVMHSLAKADVSLGSPLCVNGSRTPNRRFRSLNCCHRATVVITSPYYRCFRRFVMQRKLAVSLGLFARLAILLAIVLSLPAP